MSMYQTLTLASASASASATASAAAATDAVTSFSRSRVNIPGVQNRVRAVATESPPSRRSSGRSSSESFYEVLRVDYNATATEIKTAYRSLAKIYHPDLSGGGRGQSNDGRDFIEIHKAYATLSDPVARQHYDLSIGVGIRESDRRYRRAFTPGFYPTRTWETDQCW